MSSSHALTIEDVLRCFTGVIPLALATASADDEPNVTYVSRAHPVDPERIAISNQFLSKTHRNLAENPRASLLLTDPMTMDEYRASVVFEQTLRRGPVFDHLRRDLSMIAALTGMQDVFRLAGADVFRVTRIDPVVVSGRPRPPAPPVERMFAADYSALGELCGRLSRCGDLDTLVEVLVSGLDDLLGYDHSILLLSDEIGERLFTIASNGYSEQGVGSEIAVGDGIAGQAALLCAPVRADPLMQMTKYARSLRAAVSGEVRDVPLPGLRRPGSQLAVPAMTMGVVVGVLLVESERHDRFSQADEAVLSIVASLVSGMIQALRREAPAPSSETMVEHGADVVGNGPAVIVRHYPVDASTFLDGDYLIKGVAARLLWTVLQQYTTSGRTEFTNREMRLELALEMPDFRDNFESRLILLKRRLDERHAPIRLHKTGRGRFRIDVSRPITLHQAAES